MALYEKYIGKKLGVITEGRIFLLDRDRQGSSMQLEGRLIAVDEDDLTFEGLETVNKINIVSTEDTRRCYGNPIVYGPHFKGIEGVVRIDKIVSMYVIEE
jgi:hypothetical protein